MTKAAFTEKAEFEPLAVGLAETFIQRRDLYARQLEDGNYICIHRPLDISHVAAHLRGESTLGAYVLDPSSQARYIVLDADEELQFNQLVNLSSDLVKQDVPSYLETSRRGGHLWLFFAKPIPGKDARHFGQNLLEAHHIPALEIFPKQAKLSGGPGSLIRLPFGVHRKTGLRYGFITPERAPLAASLAAQVQILSAPKTVPEDFIKRNLTRSPTTRPAPVSGGIEHSTKPLSERIKESISVRDFVSRYVELSPTGRGKCPFHDDQQASFAVNADGNYWHCFAGCGGGSIIDFWMKLQGCDFTSAIHQLADILSQPVQKAKEPDQ